jgi:hypothetical protein
MGLSFHGARLELTEHADYRRDPTARRFPFGSPKFPGSRQKIPGSIS